jgi:hypothetical protein
MEIEAVVIKKFGEGAKVLTSNFIPVRVPFCPVDKKQRITIRITQVYNTQTEGRICEGAAKSSCENVR